jgi:hypothetical protein
MSDERKPRLSLSARVMIGLVLRIATGVFFGERAASETPWSRFRLTFAGMSGAGR